MALRERMQPQKVTPLQQLDQLQKPHQKLDQRLQKALQKFQHGQPRGPMQLQRPPRRVQLEVGTPITQNPVALISLEPVPSITI